MPLGRYRQRLEKPLSDGLLKEELFDQLLASLVQGGEPIATDDEYWQWVKHWRDSRSSEPFPELGYERMPWPVQRYRALKLLEVFDWETDLRLQEVIREEGSAERLENGEAVEGQDIEQLKAEWLKWRSETIQRYRLNAPLEARRT